MTTNQNNSDLEQLAMHRAKIAEEIKNLDQIRRDYDAKIISLTGPGTTTAGEYKITVTQPRRLDTKALETAFPVTDHPEYYTRKIDTTAVKKHIAEVDLAAYQTEGTPQVRIS